MTTIRDLLLFYAAYKRNPGDLVWKSRTAEYFWSPSGSPLRHSDVIENLNAYNDHMSERVNFMAKGLAEGGDLGRWQEQMTAIIKDNHRVSYMAGRGGRDAMTQADWGSVGGDINFELRHLNNFALDIAGGNMTPGQIAARADMYARASHTAFEKGYRNGKHAAGYTEERRTSAGDDNVCGECAQYEAMGWQAIGTLPAPGEQCACMSNCRCDLEFRGSGSEEIAPPAGPMTLTENSTREDYAAAHEYLDKTLTEDDRSMLEGWGRSGRGIRDAQADGIQTPEWNATVDKLPIYEGKVQRGLSGVPKETIDGWINSEYIQLTNDQSATNSKTLAFDEFVAGREGRVVWEIEQKTGRDVLGQTRVTIGGKPTNESEVILRMGTKYRVESVEFRYIDAAMDRWDITDPDNWPSYVTRDGRHAFISDNYFEGHPFSWPHNQPEGWDIGHDTLGIGTYFFKLVEIA